MRKVIVSIFIASAALVMFSCRSSKEALSLSSMNGEWNIIEINGSAVVPGQGQQLPFIRRQPSRKNDRTSCRF